MSRNFARSWRGESSANGHDDGRLGSTGSTTGEVVIDKGVNIPDAGPGYRLAAAGREAAEDERLGLLEQIYDPGSRRRRAIVQPGWRCLEVGGGRGSMAVWLAQKVGPTGHVVATDIDLGYLRRLDVPNLEVLEHNILEDPLEPLGLGSFDLVCSRLTLFHLVGRQELAVRQMVRVPAPRRLAD